MVTIGVKDILVLLGSLAQSVCSPGLVRWLRLVRAHGERPGPLPLARLARICEQGMDAVLLGRVVAWFLHSIAICYHEFEIVIYRLGLFCAFCIVLGLTSVVGSVDASLPPTSSLNLLHVCRAHALCPRRDVLLQSAGSQSLCLRYQTCHLGMDLHHVLALAVACSLQCPSWVPPPDPFPSAVPC